MGGNGGEEEWMDGWIHGPRRLKAHDCMRRALRANHVDGERQSVYESGGRGRVALG